MAEEKKRQKILLLILAVVVLGAVVWLLFLQKGSQIEEFVTKPTISPTEQKVKDVQLNLDILNNALFKELKTHGLLPVVPGETGKENPFK